MSQAGETAVNVEILTFKRGKFTEGHQRTVNHGCPTLFVTVLWNTGDQLIAGVHHLDTRDLPFAGVLRSIFDVFGLS